MNNLLLFAPNSSKTVPPGSQIHAMPRAARRDQCLVSRQPNAALTACFLKSHSGATADQEQKLERPKPFGDRSALT
jgi:hypothetical protein